MGAPQVVVVAAPARAVEILMAGSREAVHHVEAIAGGGSRRRPGEEGHAQRLPRAGHGDPFDSDRFTRSRRLGGCGGVAGCVLARQDGDLFALIRQFVGDPPRDIFDTTGARDEAFDHDGDAQGGCPRVGAQGYL
ncbi:MAG: hypothetical protein CL933_13305 [Deltaproteobacteria bacterium]|nr:hypothetical protein [Deltaproteobacteria bacterium]